MKQKKEKEEFKFERRKSGTILYHYATFFYKNIVFERIILSKIIKKVKK